MPLDYASHVAPMISDMGAMLATAALVLFHRSLQAHGQFPVVFITAKAQSRDMAELMALGAAATISKPFSPKDLPDQLRAIWKKLP